MKKLYPTILLIFLFGCINTSLDYPINGVSPYDYYFGEGVYDSTGYSVIVNTSEHSDIVFILKDVESKQVIRNVFIASNSTFSLDSIPYGVYEFTYFGGNDWSDTLTINNGKIEGSFANNVYFEKSMEEKDRIKCVSGYTGTFTITLTQEINGNLETQPSNEVEFFEMKQEGAY